ncbi:cyclic GMP-AMP synthase DncV-like nucleotidyltransferase, partial [Planctomycetota bacterium]
RDKLLEHRKSNRNRLITNLPKHIEGITIGVSSFKPQGSVAMKTVIQTRFDDEEYDIDDGLVLKKSDLVDEKGNELTAMEVKGHVRKALEDKRFNRQPRLQTNCVRVFYSDQDKERHHVDFPVYRKLDNNKDEEQRELASSDEWIESDPTQVNRWFEDEIAKRNNTTDGKGTQMRRLVQLLKRFCRSRKTWDMPNGMKLTMLVSECQPTYSNRIDKAFRDLLESLKSRLEDSKKINNLAHPDKPHITKTSNDSNVCELLCRIEETLDKLEILDDKDCTKSDARSAWDWVFKSDGFFDDYDGDDDKESKSYKKESAGLVSAVPKRPVDHHGGGRFG